MAYIAPPLPSPGVGARRRGSKILPTLPLSAFSPPNTGASNSFPLAPSPSTVHPEQVIDAHVVVRDNQINQWKSEVGPIIGDRSSGVIVSLQGKSAEGAEKAIETLQSNAAGVKILSFLIPFPFEDGVPTNCPAYIASSSKTPIHFTLSYTKPSEELANGINWALKNGHVVDIDAGGTIAEGHAGWEGLEDLVDKALGAAHERKGAIVLANILPPPHSLTLPIVKLLSDPTYRAYQSHLAALSLFVNVHVKFLPPMWDAPTPRTPRSDSQPNEARDAADKEKREWKRRIKMYIGPAVEAFGYERIIFGSSPSTASQSPSNAGDWYALARESFAELGLEQEDIDAVFFKNARNVYTPS